MRAYPTVTIARGTTVAAVITLAAVMSVASGCTAPADSPEHSPAAVAFETHPAASAFNDITVSRIPYPTSGPADPAQNYGDLYLPAGPQADNTIPLVVLIHGGGWKAAYSASAFNGLARELAAHGVAVWNLEYRRVGSGGGWPTTFRDVADAVNDIPTVLADHPQLDSRKVITVGHSAGGQLAVWASTRQHADAALGIGSPVYHPAAVISISGPLNLVHAATDDHSAIEKVLGGTPSQLPEHYAEIDPIQNLDPSIPVIAIHGSNDHVVSPSSSITYTAALRADGGYGSLIIIPGASHVSLVTLGNDASRRVIKEIVATAKHPDSR